MKAGTLASLLFVLAMPAAMPAWAADFPEWAYPAVPPHVPSPSPELKSLPGSSLQFRQGQIDSGYEVADWYPSEHPPMPRVVSHGGEPPLRACAMCHLPSGNGHPETGGLSGLPATYAAQQILAFANGSRKGSRANSMVPIAKAMTPEQIRESSEYFAALPATQWTRVEETEEVAKTFLGLGAVRYRMPEGGTEPLAGRIIEVPEDDAKGALRDSHTGFVAYVPMGSIARGKEMVQSATGACAACHGETLKGMDSIPGIVGRSALSTFRALNDIKLGQRVTLGATSMRTFVSRMSQDDMVAVSAFLASLPP